MFKMFYWNSKGCVNNCSSDTDRIQSKSNGDDSGPNNHNLF